MFAYTQILLMHACVCVSMNLYTHKDAFFCFVSPQHSKGLRLTQFAWQRSDFDYNTP